MADEQNSNDDATKAAEAAAAEAKRIADAAKLAEDAAKEAIRVAEEKAEADRKANPASNKADSDMIARLVQDRLDTELSAIKKSLDSAYKARDEANAKLAAQEAKEKEANIARLKEDGKFKEAYEIQLADARARNEALERTNTELSRDVTVREALRGFTFRNEKAANMAFKEITTQLIQNEHKEWIHRSGISIRDYCEAFSKDEDQSFLFKPKANAGNGISATNSGNGNAGDSNKPQSLFKMSQADVLKLAAEGKLPARATR
jgi:hypothetical protein